MAGRAERNSREEVFTPMMTRTMLTLTTLLGAVLLSLGGCTCGFDCSSDSDDDSAGGNTLFTLGFTDAPAENLKQVVIEVSKITLTRTSDDDVEFDNFTIPELGETNTDSFQVDLLLYQGTQQVLVITEAERPADSYNSIVIEINSGNSFVKDENDVTHALQVTDDQLVLPGIALLEDEERHTIEFNLARSLRFATQEQVYRLDDDGIRTIENKDLATLKGSLDDDLFDSQTPCSRKNDPLKGNRVYLYEGTGLTDTLGDVFDDGASDAPAGVLAPYAVARLIEPTSTLGWRYEFGFLPEGDYTIAFSCDASGDDPQDYDDDIAIPFPADQVYEVTLEADEITYCDIEEDSDC